MTILQTTGAGLKRVRQLINQSNDMSPHTGVWVTRISREAAIFQFAFMALGFMANLALLWVGERTEKQWAGTVMVFMAFAVALISTALAHALDRQPDRPPSSNVFMLWAGLTAVAGIGLGHLVFFVAGKMSPIVSPSLLLRFFPEFIVAVIIGVSYWRLVIVRLWYERLATAELKRQAAEQGQALAQTQLHMLQAQIEPHFLFNTLASVQHLVRKDPEQADFLLTQLISYLRQAIPDVRGAASTLGREFSSIETYLDIVRIRMGGRLSVTVQCDSALAEVTFPTLVIHTLVENAIRHGVELKPGPVSVAVLARQTDGGIEISVTDSGVGLGAVQNGSGGVGLRNIRERLALAYDGRARLDVADAPGGGVCATINIAKESK
jgi:signal transduction histidine kinase